MEPSCRNSVRAGCTATSALVPGWTGVERTPLAADRAGGYTVGSHIHKHLGSIATSLDVSDDAARALNGRMHRGP